MSNEIFRQLIDGLHSALEIEDSPSKYEVCNLVCSGAFFSLRHGKEADPDGLFIICDFGEVPEENRALIYQRLLETNLFLFGNNAPNFGFNPDTGRVNMMIRVPLSSLSLEDLTKVLANTAAYVQVWRRSYFLTPREIHKITEDLSS